MGKEFSHYFCWVDFFPPHLQKCSPILRFLPCYERRGQFLSYTFNTEPDFPPLCIFYDKPDVITFSRLLAILLLELPSQPLRGQRPSASAPCALWNMDSQAPRRHPAREAEK